MNLIVLFSIFTTLLFPPKLEESLIIFVQEEDAFFIKNALPPLRDFTEKNGIKLIEKAVLEGIPGEITSTPAIVYQNHRGRSVYANRYMTFSTLKNFIRTSRYVPQRVAENCWENLLVKKIGKTKVGTPLKITDLNGDRPDDFVQKALETEITAAFTTTSDEFKLASKTCFQKTDRLFYFDLHPYRDVNDDFFLNLEIFSQFNCKSPVFKNTVKGKFATKTMVIKEAVLLLRRELERQMTESEIGDAFTPIDEAMPMVAWENLGLSLPEAPLQTADEASKNLKIPEQWTFYKAIDEATPIVQFRFMAPLDRYIGELKKIDGTFAISKDNDSMKGKFIADMQSLTMGSEDFDYNVLNKYIKAYRFPKSSFEFAEQTLVPKLVFGETTRVNLKGTFSLMRQKRPVEVMAQLTPVLDEKGEVLLQVSATFSLNVVKDFGIKGPDGPAPAREMMLFDLNFLMK